MPQITEIAAVFAQTRTEALTVLLFPLAVLDSNILMEAALVLPISNFVIYLIIYALDVNECLTNNGNCNGTCTNTNGSFICTPCSPGYNYVNGGCAGMIYFAVN